MKLRYRLFLNFISFHKTQQRVMVDAVEEPLDYDIIQKNTGNCWIYCKRWGQSLVHCKSFLHYGRSIQEQNEGIEEVKPGDKLLIVKEMGM